jgi:hypothetical protein
MRIILALVPFIGLAACAGDRAAAPPNVGEGQRAVPPVEYRSAFADYKPFADEELADWRKANDEVGAAGGHAGHKPGQGPGQQTSKPEPGKPAGHQ